MSHPGEDRATTRGAAGRLPRLAAQGLVLALVAGATSAFAVLHKQVTVDVDGSSTQVQAGVALVNRSGESLNAITARIVELESIISGIAAASQEQSSGLGEISAAIGSMDTITQQNATMVDNTSTQISDLTAQVGSLTEALRGFKTRDPAQSSIRTDGYDRQGAGNYGLMRRPNAA